MRIVSDCIILTILAFILRPEHHVKNMSATTPSVAVPRKKSRSLQDPAKKTQTLRTTVSLSPLSAIVVDNFKAATGLSTSRAIEQLILRSVPRKPRVKMVNGLAVFDLPVESGSITDELLRRLEDEPW
jgi:hypothetical protein